MARTFDEGGSESLTLTVPAGLYQFLTLHARRATLGKSQGEVALYMIQQQAITWNGESFLGVNLPANDFPNPKANESQPS